MSTITKDLGVVTAYGYALTKGYTGTEEEFAELMASYATVAEQAAQSAETAEEAAQAAAQAVLDANAAKEAAQQSATGAASSAQSASSSASSASQSASSASQSAEAASGSAQTASTKATEAAGSATAASESATAAATAKTGAETAQGKAEDAQAAAEAAQQNAEQAAEEVAGSAAQIETNKNDIAELKDDVDQIQNNTDVGLFGALWDRTTNLLTRTRNAKGITTDTTNFCHKGTINANYDNPFDKIYPWAEMVVCNVDLTKYRSGNYSLKDCITAVYGDPDFTYYGDDTNFVGRYRPEFWYNSIEDENGNIEFLVSQIEREGFTHAPEAIDGISFVVDDGSGNNKVTSGANVPLTNIAVSQIHARAKASGFTLQDIFTLDQQIILYLVEYANMNSQAAIGDGCSSCYRENAADVISNVSVVDGVSVFEVGSGMSSVMHVGAQLDFGTSTGAVTYRGLIKSFELNSGVYTVTLDRELAISDGLHVSGHGFGSCEFPLLGESIGNASGYLGTAQKANAYYRGVVLYANRYSYTLGVYRQTGTNRIWICPDGVDPDDYDALNVNVHKDTGVALPDLETAAWQTVGGNAQKMEDVKAFLLTGPSSGSSSSPVGDQQYVPLASAGNTILLFGCNANNGWYCGLFGGYWLSSAGNSYWLYAGLPILKKPL